MLFESPTAFWLALLLFLVAALRLLWKKKITGSLTYSSVQILKVARKSLRSRLMELPTIFKLIAIGLMIYALARPQLPDEKIRKDVEGIDIILLVDLSGTMQIEDMQPFNRIEAAREAQIEFVKNRPTDRIGVVAFAGEAYTVVPLTLDHRMVIEALKRLDNKGEIKDGTAQGVAVALAAARLKDSTAKSKIIVFVTDGENNTGFVDPETAIEIAKGYGIKIYTIGVGSDGVKNIPFYTKDVFGNKVKTYQKMDVTFFEDQLVKLAESTQGKYWRSRSMQELSDVYAEIDRLEKTKIESSTYVKKIEVFQKYLIFALILWCLGYFLEQTWLRKEPAI